MYVSWNLVAKGQVIIHHQGGSEDFFRGGVSMRIKREYRKLTANERGSLEGGDQVNLIVTQPKPSPTPLPPIDNDRPLSLINRLASSEQYLVHNKG